MSPDDLILSKAGWHRINNLNSKLGRGLNW
jgi:hypothetical protein